MQATLNDAVLLFTLGVCTGVELTRLAVDWNHELPRGGSMKRFTFILLATMSAVLLAGASLADTCEPSKDRVFVDVAQDHPFCAEIEELWRRGGATGCRVLPDLNETRYYCPGSQPTRAQLAAIAAGLMPEPDPMVRLSPLGEVVFGVGVVSAERLGDGVYRVGIARDVLRCILRASTPDTAPAVLVSARVIAPDVTAAYIYATQDGAPRDTTIDLTLRCAAQ